MLLFFLENSLSVSGLIGKMFGGGAVPTVWMVSAIILCFIISYLLGSLNSAVIVSKMMFKDDIRNHGSGNAGFTNMMRTFGTKAAGITFAGDILKTVIAVVFTWLLIGYVAAYIAGLGCFLGHLFPVFYQFRGGKGVLCVAAMMLTLDWQVLVGLVLVFMVGALVTKYISFGSILAAMAYPLLVHRLAGYGIYTIISFVIAAIVFIKHIPNLKRILNGTESKFKFKKSKEVKTDAEQ